jgi:hypothetical protein
VESTACAVPGYNVIAPIRSTFAQRSFRARENESLEPVTLHILDRSDVDRGALAAVRADLPPYADLRHERLVRPRRVRADENVVLVETDPGGAESLEALLDREGKIDPSRALALLEDILVGLVAAEMRGLHHGSLRPSTVQITPDGRAALDAFGFGALLPRTEDFYGALERLVPVPRDRRHAKDVYAAAALFHRMVEGRPPLDPPAGGDMKGHVAREKWTGTAYPDIYAAVSPLGRTEAGPVLALVRKHRRGLAAPEPAAAPTILDAAEEPTAPPPPAGGESIRELARAAIRAPAWPIAAAALLAAALAGLFASPFLGGDSWPSRAIAQAPSLPASAALPASAPKPAPPPRQTPAAKAAPAAHERAGHDVAAKERILALAAIGDFSAALDEIEKGGAAALREDVLAEAQARFRENVESARALAAEGNLAEAQREIDALARYWPTSEMRAQAVVERAALAVQGADLQKEKRRRDAEASLRRLDEDFRELARRCLCEEGHDGRARLQQLEAFRARLGSDAPADVRRDAEDLAGCLNSENALFARAQEQVRLRPRPLASITARFGTGDIVALSADALTVNRSGGAAEKLPLSRLTCPEKIAFFNAFRAVRSGPQAVGMAILALRWDNAAQARAELLLAESANDSPLPQIRFLQKFIEDEK